MRRRALPFAAALAGLIACSSASNRGFDDDASAPSPSASTQPSGPSTPFGDAGALDAAPATCDEDIDVVFVLDVSSSMDFVLDKLSSEIQKVVDAANKLKSGAHFGLVIFVDNDKLDTTGDQSGGKVHTSGTTLAAAFEDAKNTYTFPNRNPGDGPNGPTLQNPLCEEDSLDALHDTATDFPWRANAAHVAILVTDDTFLENPDNYGDRDGDGKEDKTDFPREGNYPARFTVPQTVTALKTALVRVFSFTRLQAPGLFDLTKCGTGRRHPTDDCVTYGWSQPYGTNPPIPTSTGGKNYDLDAVRNGSLSLAATINEIVLASHCAGPPH